MEIIKKNCIRNITPIKIKNKRKGTLCLIFFFFGTFLKKKNKTFFLTNSNLIKTTVKVGIKIYGRRVFLITMRYNFFSPQDTTTLDHLAHVARWSPN
jgi:uncharacterized beta-barrel protein YwiB (DUF1934 family)